MKCTHIWWCVSFGSGFAVNAIVNHGRDIDKVIESLLARPFTKEI